MNQKTDKEKTVYASPGTIVETYALHQKMLELAGADLILVRPEDIKGKTGQETKMLFQQIIPDDVYRKSFENFTDDDWQTLANEAHNGASANGWDLNGDGKNDLGIINTGDIPKTGAQDFERFTKIGAHRLTNVPGSGFDYLAMTLFHEAAHIGQDLGPTSKIPYELNPQLYETDADKKALQAYQQEKERIFLNPDVPNAYIDARIGSALINPGGEVEMIHCAVKRFMENSEDCTGIPTHITHVGLEQNIGENGLPLPAAQINESLLGVMKVQSYAHIIREGLFAADEMKTWEKQGIFSLQSQMMGIENPQELFKKTQESPGEIGGFLATEDPEGSMAIIDKLDQKGIFDNEPAAKKYVMQLHAFFEKYSPDYKNSIGYTSMAQALDQIPEALEAMSSAAQQAETAGPRKTDPSLIKMASPAPQ